MTRYALNPAMPVLLRPDGAVQVGWDPRRAVLVHPPSGLTAAALAELLRTHAVRNDAWPSCSSRFGIDADDAVVDGRRWWTPAS